MQVSMVTQQLLAALLVQETSVLKWVGEFQGHFISGAIHIHLPLRSLELCPLTHSEFTFVIKWCLFLKISSATEEVSLSAWFTGRWLDDLHPHSLRVLRSSSAPQDCGSTVISQRLWLLLGWWRSHTWLKSAKCTQRFLRKTQNIPLGSKRAGGSRGHQARHEVVTQEILQDERLQEAPEVQSWCAVLFICFKSALYYAWQE